MKQTKVSVNLQQDFTSSEKAQARSNIGAASSTDLSTEVSRATTAEAAAKTEVVAGTNTTVTSTTGANGQTVYTVSSTANENAKTRQTPVNETYSSYSCVTALRQSDNGNVELDTEQIPAATDQAPGLMDSTDKAKLDGIEAGAQVNVQANWTATSGPAQILNKVEIAKKERGASANTELSSLVLDADFQDGSVQVEANGTGMGKLVSGPYATLLDSGINGVGDSTHPVYIDGNGEFQRGSAIQSYSVFTTTADGLAPKANGTGDTERYLKGDGTWSTPANTTYTAGSGLALNGTEFSNTAPNVKSDWNAAAGSAAEILNKPTIPDNVFLAEYGVATVAEISAAKNAGKEVFTLIPGTYFSTVAYLREVTRNGANANFASVTSDGASVKTATVDSSGNWSNTTVNLATTTDSSLIQKKNYGDPEPSRVATLLIDSDDPEGYAQVKADNATKGYLVKGPYATLLDSGVNGVGDGDTPVYIDSDGTFKSCNALTAGSNVQINGTTISATDTTYTAGSYISISNANVITNTMHLDTTGLMISYNTLGNSGVTTHSFGPWRIELTKDAMATWDSGLSGSESVHLKFAHSDFLDGSIIHGKTLVDIYYPWKDGNYSDVYTGHNQWPFDGTYSSGNLNGFPIYLESPTDADSVNRACPKKMRGFKFTVNCGINSPDWLECTVNPLYINSNTSIQSNAARLLIQVKYFYV